MAGFSLLSTAPGQLSSSFCNSAAWNCGNTLLPTRSTSSGRLPVVSIATRSELAASETVSRRPLALGTIAANVFLGSTNLFIDNAEAASSSKQALKSEQTPESEYTALPNGLKYFDLKVGAGPLAQKGSRVAVHYVAKWKGITFMTSRQGMGVTGGLPYGFDIGASEAGIVLKGLDQGVAGMRVGGQRLLIVPPELAYGKRGVQEIPPNVTIEFNVELLRIK